MKKFGKFKGRKHAVTATCMLVGMMVLTSAVYANYDDARGYTNYKEAVKDLLLNADNFTMDGGMQMSVDGTVMADAKGVFKLDGDSYSSTMTTTSDGQDSYTYEGYGNNGKIINYYPAGNFYHEYEGNGNPLGRPDGDDPTMKKAIKFAELFADTMVGDLKNNFVLVSSEGDLREYSVNISGSQIPEIVNAGLSLLFTSYNNRDNTSSNFITYEDYNKAFAAFYLEETGKEMDEDAYYEWDEEMEKINEAFYEYYGDILSSKNDTGIVYVKADGSYEYYKTYEQYQEDVSTANMNGDQIMDIMGNDPYIENAACNFTLDKQGNLVATVMEATMTGTDENGKKHSVTMKMNGAFSDYGQTEADTFDSTGKNKKN